MDVSVVLDLDLAQLRHLVRLGTQAQRAQAQQAAGGGSDEVRVPGMTPPTEGPGSSKAPLRTGARASAATVALVAIVAEKITESVLNFAKQELNNSRVLNSYFGAMGKTLSAAVDILLIPFTPVLNLLLMAMVKFAAWLTGNGHLAAISAGIEKMGDMARTFIEWAQKVWGFFNNTWNPANWDWASLLAGISNVFSTVVGGITTAMKRVLGWAVDMYNKARGWFGSQVKSGLNKAIPHSGDVLGAVGGKAWDLGQLADVLPDRDKIWNAIKQPIAAPLSNARMVGGYVKQDIRHPNPVTITKQTIHIAITANQPLEAGIEVSKRIGGLLP